LSGSAHRQQGKQQQVELHSWSMSAPNAWNHLAVSNPGQ